MIDAAGLGAEDGPWLSVRMRGGVGAAVAEDLAASVVAGAGEQRAEVGAALDAVANALGVGRVRAPRPLLRDGAAFVPLNRLTRDKNAGVLRVD